MNPITSDQLRAAYDEERYAIRLRDPEVYPNAAQWQYITDHAMGTLAPRLYRKYLVSFLTPKEERTPQHEAALKMFATFLRAINRDDAVKAIYSDVTSSPDATLAIIDECELFDANELIRLAEDGETQFVADALNTFMPEYTEDDLNEMSRLAVTMTNLPARGEVREVRGLFRNERKYVCPNGHANPPEAEFCNEPSCGLNIYGINRDGIENLRKYNQRLDILSRLIADEKRKEAHRSANNVKTL